MWVEFDADFKSAEKVGEVTAHNKEMKNNNIRSLLLYVNNFFTTFSPDSKSASNFSFIDTHSDFL
jgi:hypothetical protein